MNENIRDGDVLPMEILACQESWSFGINVYVRQRTVGQGVVFAAPMTMVKPGSTPQPLMNLDAQAAQQLVDELWKCGVRPSEGSGSAGSLAATERHLADMRTIALGLLAKHGVQEKKA